MIERNQPQIKIMPNIKGAYLKASATVEGALVIPIVLFAVLTIMYLLQIVAIETKVYEALFETMRRCSSYAYIYENVTENASFLRSLSDDSKGSNIKAIASTGINDAIFLGMFIDTLGSDYASNNYIVGGNAGLVVLRSSILKNNSKIEVVIDYCIKNPFDIFGIGIIKKKATAITDGWLGRDADTFEDLNGEEGEIYVYITADGEVYHKDASCTYLTRDVLSCTKKEIANKRNKSNAKYYACETCNAKSQMGIVYYTSYGTRYHSSSECSQLHRDIMCVPLSSVQSRRSCSKCGG